MRTLLAATLIVLGTAAAGSSASLALWTFDGTNNVPVTSTASGVTAGNLTQNGLTQAFPGSSLFFSASDWPVGSYGAPYLEFSVAPIPGNFIDYSTVTLDYTIGTNPTFTTELLSSADGFTAPLSTHTSSPGSTSYSDSLATLGVEGSSVTFRFFGFVDSSFGASGLYAGSMSLNATGNAVLATPEPASLGWAAGLGLAMIAWRRRRAA